MQQEWHGIFFNLQVALVNVGGEGQRVHLFRVQLRRQRVVNDLSVFAVTYSQNLAQGFTVGVLHYGMIKLPPRDKIDVFAGVECLLRPDVPGRTHKRNLHAGIGFFDLADELHVAAQADS